jgi:hypothetical protein
MRFRVLQRKSGNQLLIKENGAASLQVLLQMEGYLMERL